MTWLARQLKSYSKSGTNVTYTYDADGLRGSKTVNGVKSVYKYVNGQLRYENRGGHDIYYYYDSYGYLMAIRYYKTDSDSLLYYAATNAQGDVLGLYGGSGTLYVSYEYDSWGNLISMTDTTSVGIGSINPIRYRGYYFDDETGLYYLQSRYYDPQVGRWISAEPNADSFGFDAGAGLLGYNVYSYCANNPVMYKDEAGESITLACILIFGGIGLVAGGWAGYKLAQYYNVPKGEKWKYVLGGILIGGAAGFLLGWGIGAAATAVAAKYASIALFGGRVVTSNIATIQLLQKFYEKTKDAMNVKQLKQFITLCQKFGLDITAKLGDLVNVVNHKLWNGIPHIHVGNSRTHIALTKEAVKYIRKVLGI